MTVKYDPLVIQEFADRLYEKATKVIRTYTIMGVIFLGLVGLAAGDPTWGALGSILGGVIGYIVGKEKAFVHKLHAQTALCQVKIERNAASDQGKI